MEVSSSLQEVYSSVTYVPLIVGLCYFATSRWF